MSRERDKTLSARLRNLQGKEDEDLGPHSRVMCIRIDTKRFECGHEDDNGGPTVPHGEWQVDE